MQTTIPLLGLSKVGQDAKGKLPSIRLSVVSVEAVCQA